MRAGSKRWHLQQQTMLLQGIYGFVLQGVFFVIQNLILLTTPTWHAHLCGS